MGLAAKASAPRASQVKQRALSPSLESKPTNPNARVLARRLGRSFAGVALVAAAACGLLLFFLIQVANSVHQMQRDESAIRTGLGLATAVREQYIHAAHTIIIGDRSHLDHYAEWVEKVRAGTGALRSAVPEEERWRIDRIETISREMDRLFTQQLIVAVLARDRDRMLEAHHQLEEQVAVAAGDADRIAQSVESRMSQEHVGATHVTRVATSIAVLGILLLVSLSVISTRSLQNAVIRPLHSLAEAATRIGAGDFGGTVLVAAEGELGLVARAFSQMAEQLSQHQRRLIASERMAAIGQLAAGVAHEINNPIGVIRGYLRTMIPEVGREQLRKELLILDEEAAACQRIADDLVAYARAPEISRADIDVGALVITTAERFEASGESKGSRVCAEADHVDLSVDAIRIRQVLQNLLRNAVQAAPGGSAIEVYGVATSDAYVVRVLDRGSGIPDELRTRIFEPFVSGRINGTGLGLAVCSGILRAHGGEISARPRDGGGSEFVVELPRRQPPALDAHPSANREHEPHV
jgi:two-component system NtrC family sensor kinase